MRRSVSIRLQPLADAHLDVVVGEVAVEDQRPRGTHGLLAGDLLAVSPERPGVAAVVVVAVGIGQASGPEDARHPLGAVRAEAPRLPGEPVLDGPVASLR